MTGCSPGCPPASRDGRSAQLARRRDEIGELLQERKASSSNPSRPQAPSPPDLPLAATAGGEKHLDREPRKRRWGGGGFVDSARTHADQLVGPQKKFANFFFPAPEFLFSFEGEEKGGAAKALKNESFFSSRLLVKAPNFV